MNVGFEYLGTRLAVIFDLAVPTARRHEELTRIGNPVLESNDSIALYVVGVPDGQDYFWVRKYRAVAGVASVEEIRPLPVRGSTEPPHR